jgi:hypothetical protein
VCTTDVDRLSARRSGCGGARTPHPIGQSIRSEADRRIDLSEQPRACQMRRLLWSLHDRSSSPTDRFPRNGSDGRHRCRFLHSKTVSRWKPEVPAFQSRPGGRMSDM